MNLFKLSWANLRAKPLSTFLSLLLLTMGVGIISLLLLLNKQVDEQFSKNIRGIDMVVGAKGSPLQLILSAVYHIDNPTGNIVKAEADKLAKHPLVKKAIPMAYGDNLKGYRILGTDTSYVNHYKGKVADGRLWEKTMESTLGAVVAERLGMKIGDTFYGTHGLDAESDDVHKNREYVVVGILEKSGTVLDQLILTEVSSLWAVHEKEPVEGEGELESESGETQPDEEITAMLLKFRSPMGMIMLPRYVNEQTNMQAGMPAYEMARLNENMGVGITLLQSIAILIIIISGISVFVSLYNSLKDRKYELALMRTMGASQGTLFALIVMEGLLLAAIGYVFGLLLSRASMVVLGGMMEDSYRYQFSAGQFLPEELVLLAGALLIGFLAALLPALKAFNTDIHATLSEA
jgi:putative ABC transport system permease protein